MASLCKCGASKAIFCNTCSRYKMVMCLKNGFDHLKETTKQNKLVNPVWHSVLSKDSKPQNRVFANMLRRYANSKYAGAAQLIQFYDNQTKTIITTYKTI